jgi:hypothetical protein
MRLIVISSLSFIVGCGRRTWFFWSAEKLSHTQPILTFRHMLDQLCERRNGGLALIESTVFAVTLSAVFTLLRFCDRSNQLPDSLLKKRVCR